MLFSNPVIFELPVLPRVQKYIRAKLTDPAGAYHPMLASPLAPGPGLIVWTLAQSEKRWLFSGHVYRQGRSQRPPAQQIKFDQKLTARIGVGICEFHHSRHQYLLNYLELEVFSNLIDYLIHNELVQYCQQTPQVAPMVRIKQFCDRYDFSDEDFTEGALKQMYLRHRKGRGAAQYSPEVSGNFQFFPMQLAAA